VNSDELSSRLSQIQTRWSLVFLAHQNEADAATRARAALVQRYHGAIYRYLLGAVRDPHVADDLAQDFFLRLVRGDFKRANREHGLFRKFLKTSLYHLVVDHQRRRSAHQMAEGCPEPWVESPTAEAEREFAARWREELLDRAWDALAELEQESHQPYYTLLRYRAEHPDVRSAQMGVALKDKLGKELSEVAVRKTLQRARERFADLLLKEVARSLQTTAVEAVEQELIDLDLLSYCRSALERFARKEGLADAD
jgi:RNA polymerase sigma-70 factor (ECF subfamily)